MSKPNVSKQNQKCYKYTKFEDGPVTWYREVQEKMGQKVYTFFNVPTGKLVYSINNFTKDTYDCKFLAEFKTPPKGGDPAKNFKGLFTYADQCEFTDDILSFNGSYVYCYDDGVKLSYEYYAVAEKFFNVGTEIEKQGTEIEEQTGYSYAERYEIVKRHGHNSEASPKDDGSRLMINVQPFVDELDALTKGSPKENNEMQKHVRPKYTYRLAGIERAYIDLPDAVEYIFACKRKGLKVKLECELISDLNHVVTDYEEEFFPDKERVKLVLLAFVDNDGMPFRNLRMFPNYCNQSVVIKDSSPKALEAAISEFDEKRKNMVKKPEGAVINIVTKPDEEGFEYTLHDGKKKHQKYMDLFKKGDKVLNVGDFDDLLNLMVSILSNTNDDQKERWPQQVHKDHSKKFVLFLKKTEKFLDQFVEEMDNASTKEFGLIVKNKINISWLGAALFKQHKLNNENPDENSFSKINLYKFMCSTLLNEVGVNPTTLKTIYYIEKIANKNPLWFEGGVMEVKKKTYTATKANRVITTYFLIDYDKTLIGEDGEIIEKTVNLIKLYKETYPGVETCFLCVTSRFKKYREKIMKDFKDNIGFDLDGFIGNNMSKYYGNDGKIFTVQYISSLEGVELIIHLDDDFDTLKGCQNVAGKVRYLPLLASGINFKTVETYRALFVTLVQNMGTYKTTALQKVKKGLEEKCPNRTVEIYSQDEEKKNATIEGMGEDDPQTYPKFLANIRGGMPKGVFGLIDTCQSSPTTIKWLNKWNERGYCDLFICSFLKYHDLSYTTVDQNKKEVIHKKYVVDEGWLNMSKLGVTNRALSGDYNDSTLTLSSEETAVEGKSQKEIMENISKGCKRLQDLTVNRAERCMMQCANPDRKVMMLSKYQDPAKKEHYTSDWMATIILRELKKGGFLNNTTKFQGHLQLPVSKKFVATDEKLVGSNIPKVFHVTLSRDVAKLDTEKLIGEPTRVKLYENSIRSNDLCTVALVKLEYKGDLLNFVKYEHITLSYTKLPSEGYDLSVKIYTDEGFEPAELRSSFDSLVCVG